MTPRPPARETAEARGVVEVWAMPARRMGCGIERRDVSGLVMVGAAREEEEEGRALLLCRGSGRPREREGERETEWTRRKER